MSGGQYLTRRPVEQFEECSWGVAPGNAIVVSSAMSMKNREDTQQFLQLAVQRYGQQVASLLFIAQLYSNIFLREATPYDLSLGCCSTEATEDAMSIPITIVLGHLFAVQANLLLPRKLK